MAGKEKPKAPRKPPAGPEKTTEGERIAKVLSRAGIASRREAERLIELGEVSVNGKVITSPALNVTAADKITVRGEPVGAPEPARLWLYYKPEGLVTSASDEKGRDTVFDHLPEDMPRVMSVGRLDLNSEGLLLLTNDGALKRRLELPSTGWLRKYRVRVKGNPTEPEIEPLRKGITIDGERFQPMEVKIDRHQGANAWLTVGLREGRNREIRRAMDHIGVTVNRLIRVSYGPFRLNELEPGQVEEVRPKVLREQLGMTGETEVETPRPTRSGPRGDARPGAKLAPRQTGSKPAAQKPAAQKPAPRKAGKPEADATARPPKRPLKPGAGLKTLSDSWQKATARPKRDAADPSRPSTTPRGGAGRSRPPAPRKG
ncbi:pseudouridine synthase [Tabrizicola sp.]|uniref:pseudouridine synthase n=1 Tax=Tabrizicola sp. TaxID=2005166 RepID=UPI00261832C4|nr:pseudouridine synthase [Tabrizicola sp.]MDM7932823.1 pseudouridine synthase [Tabrizicola sp.]